MVLQRRAVGAAVFVVVAIVIVATIGVLAVGTLVSPIDSTASSSRGSITTFKVVSTTISQPSTSQSTSSTRDNLSMLPRYFAEQQFWVERRGRRHHSLQRHKDMGFLELAIHV
jgi:hypothetical protein